MHQPGVSKTRKPFERVIVGVAERFTGEIAGGHHQHRRPRLIAGQAEQQRVQRSVGEHDAEVGVVRCHRIGDRAAGEAWHQHDRTLRSGQHPCRWLVDLGNAALPS